MRRFKQIGSNGGREILLWDRNRKVYLIPLKYMLCRSKRQVYSTNPACDAVRYNETI
jgi:hypothetical protein